MSTIEERAAQIVAEQEAAERDVRIKKVAGHLTSEDRLREIAAQTAANNEAMARAEAATRAANPFEVCVSVGGVRLDYTLGQADHVEREQVEAGIARALARLHVWYTAILNIAKLKAVGRARYDAAPAAEVAALIADDLRHVIARGHAAVTVTR
jgi:hypothetical protein